MAQSNHKRNLIVNYLPQTFTDEEFKALFQNAGIIKNCKIVRHKPSGYSYGFGFVEYYSDEDADRAIQVYNGYQLLNKKMKVAYARPGGDGIKNANLYLRGIPKNMNEEQLESIFSVFGNIVQCRILKDTGSSQSKGAGFVLFDQKSEAEKAIKKMTGEILPGGTEGLSIKYADDNAKKVKPPSVSNIPSFSSPMRANFGGGPMRGPSQNRYRYNPMQMNPGPALELEDNPNTLFVYNIGGETDEKSLWELFSQYGNILKVTVVRDASGKSKGFAFVSLGTYNEAMWAIESLNGFRYAGRPLQVSFKAMK